MTTPWQEWKKRNAERQAAGHIGPSAILNPDSEKVSDALAEARFSICEGCEHLLKATNQCKKCGCFMKIKTTLKYAECPINKW